MRRTLLIVAISYLLIANSFTAADTAYADTAARKLGRGIANTATCVLEIPVQMIKTGEQEGAISACSIGLIKGLMYTIGRCAVGVYEIVTFPFPIPARYEPIIEPEFVVSPRGSGEYMGI